MDLPALNARSFSQANFSKTMNECKSERKSGTDSGFLEHGDCPEEFPEPSVPTTQLTPLGQASKKFGRLLSFTRQSSR